MRQAFRGLYLERVIPVVTERRPHRMESAVELRIGPKRLRYRRGRWESSVRRPEAACDRGGRTDGGIEYRPVLGPGAIQAHGTQPGIGEIVEAGDPGCSNQ